MILREYQFDCLARSKSALDRGVNRQLAVLATGLGKCLGKGTPVLMFDGTIMPVESVRTGDLLMGPDSGPRRVVSLAHGHEEMFRIVPTKGEPYTVNRSHILSLKMTPRGTRWPSYLGKRLDISVDEYLTKSRTFKHMAKGWRTGVDFPLHREPLYIPPYLMGVWLGDGASATTRITSGDPEVIEYLFQYAAENGLRIHVEDNSENSKVYAISAQRGNRNVFREHLRRYEMLGNKHVPHRYLTGSRQERLELLAGIIDTDDHLASRGCFDICLKSERLLDAVVFISRSLGFAAYKSTQQKMCVNNGKVGTYHRCTISGDIDQVPCKIARKQSGARRQKKDHLVTGIKVEQVGMGEYFGFAIEGADRLFLLGDFTVTHNTAIASSLRSHHGLTGKVMMLVHMDQLAQQAAKAMATWNPGAFVGVEMAGQFTRPMDTFVVASVPTLGRKGSDRIKRIDPTEYSAIIQDEAHIGMADSFKRVYDHFGLLQPNAEGPLFLGITATPNRNDGQGLKALFDEIVFNMNIEQGMDSGWLCQIRAKTISGGANLDDVHVRMGELVEGELAKAVNTPERNAIIVKAWAKFAWGRRTIWFTANIQHALDLAAAFEAHGINAKAVWGEDPERQEKINGHKDGQYPIICCAQLLGIGYDDPRISCIGMGAPIKSTVNYSQKMGRGTRIAEGKDDLLILDVEDPSKHDVCQFPSLMGLPKNLDMKGETYAKVREQLNRVAAEFPTANIQDIRNLEELKVIAENIQLFKVSYPPEVSRLTELAWTKQGEVYVLPVGRERMTVSSDLLGEWWIRGKMNGKDIEIAAQNLAGAFNAADRAILDGGGAKTLLARESRWRSDGPSDKQIKLCQKIKLAIPNGATRGMVSAALEAHFAGRRA